MAEVIRISLMIRDSSGQIREYLVSRLRVLARELGASAEELTGMDFGDVPEAGGSGTRGS